MRELLLLTALSLLGLSVLLALLSSMQSIITLILFVCGLGVGVASILIPIEENE